MSGGHSSTGIGDAIKKGVGMVHGTGEAIRGNINAGIDQAAGDRAGVDKNTAIASHGAHEIDHGYQRTGHGAGVTPVDTDRERMNTTSATSTNYGSHSTNTGNKLDPRFDSDMDHRGTATGSTNVGPHSSNVANKLDPRFDSDADHRANPNNCCTPALGSQTDGTESTTTPFGSRWEPQASGHDHDHDERCDCHADHIHRGSISGGTSLEPAQKLDPVLGTHGGSINSGPHSTDVANKLDPRVDSDNDHRGTNQSSTNHGPHSTNIGNKLDPRVDSNLDHRRPSSSTQSGRSSTLFRRGTTPLVPTTHDAHSSGSDDELDRHTRRASMSKNISPHKSDFLNLLDPRVDRHGAKQSD